MFGIVKLWRSWRTIPLLYPLTQLESSLMLGAFLTSLWLSVATCFHSLTRDLFFSLLLSRIWRTFLFLIRCQTSQEAFEERASSSAPTVASGGRIKERMWCGLFYLFSIFHFHTHFVILMVTERLKPYPSCFSVRKKQPWTETNNLPCLFWG